KPQAKTAMAMRSITLDFFIDILSKPKSHLARLTLIYIQPSQSREIGISIMRFRGRVMESDDERSHPPSPGNRPYTDFLDCVEVPTRDKGDFRHSRLLHGVRGTAFRALRRRGAFGLSC